MTNSPVSQAMKLPNGARLIRCALQVNPCGYAEQYRGESGNLAPEQYNDLLAERCCELGISAVAVTHHNHVDDCDAVASTLGAAGVTVFPGFEIGSREGVHVLCIYEPGTARVRLNRYLGQFGIHESGSNSKLSSKSFQEILRIVQSEHKGICIAAHATSESGGLLRVLKGEARVNAWRDENLLAIQIPGPVDILPEDLRPIVRNKNPDYKRPGAPADGLAVAVVNAVDVKHPDDLREPSATVRIKLASMTIEGLRQAFLDPESRLLLNSDNVEEPLVRIDAVAWSGGFLDEQAVHLSENLNVLIGGRGTGKSTVIESLRFAFDLKPLGVQAGEAFEQIVKSVIRSGSRVWVQILAQKPAPRIYVIERGVGESPVVRSERGELLHLRPADILGDLQIYGQHEIAELTRDKVRQTALIRRFAVIEDAFAQRKGNALRALQKNRAALVELRNELDRNAERLAALPGIEETLKSFKAAGLEEKLKHQSLLIREQNCLKRLDGSLRPFDQAGSLLAESLPIDTALVSEEELREFPNKDILAQGRDVLQKLDRAATAAQRLLSDALNVAKTELAALRSAWDETKLEAQQAYETTLRELHREKVDGAEFVRLREKVEELTPLEKQQNVLDQAFQARLFERDQLVVQWREALSDEHIALERAAKSVSKKLRGQVKLAVTKDGDRSAMKEFLQHLTGRRDQILQAVEKDDFSLALFSKAVLESARALQEQFKISAGQADNLSSLPLDQRLAVAEIELKTTTEVSLNVAPEGQTEDWKKLHELSKGQKATALLLLLLLQSKTPLIIDQPEDDLDNRFVTSGVVPRIRQSKRSRQFIFATHNANIPVLGDAELIAVLKASGEAGDGQGRLDPAEMGALDTPMVKPLVEDLLEGGKTAFESRRKKYRF